VWRGSVLLISISPACVDSAVLQGARWVPASVRSVPIGAQQSVSQALRAVSECMDASTRVNQVQVRISDALLAVTALPWGAQCTDTQFAREQLLGAGFVLAADDVIVIDDAPFGQPRAALAYPSAWLDALHRLASVVQAPLRSVLPWSVAAWDMAKQASALALVDQHAVLLARSSQVGARRLAEVTVRTVTTHTPTMTTLTLLWQRLCVRDAFAGQLTHVPVLHLEPTTPPDLPHPFVAVAWPKRWHHPQIAASLQLAAHSQGLRHGLNAVPHHNTLRTWQGWTLAIAAALTALVLTRAWSTYQVAQQQQAQRTVATAAMVPVAPVNKVWSREERAQAQAVNAAVRSLNLPSTALMTALQPPPNLRVALLQVDFSGAAVDNTSVKVTAQARTSEEMTRYVSWIAQQKPFTAAYLSSHEITDGTPEKLYRFTLEALWSE
jgi:hypothetical protein